MIRDERGHRKIAKSRYINPMIDGGFKILFGSEKSKELTESLLSAILGFDVVDITFLNTEDLPETLGEKPIRYDILCRDADRNKYLLEMQVKGHAGLLERTFYYIGRALSSQLKPGDDYSSLKGVYGIFLTWCGIGDDSQAFFKDFRMVNVEDMSERVDEIRQIFINLRKFAKEEDECSTMMEKWLYNLKNMNRDDKVAFAERDEVFRKLRQYAEEKNMTDDEKILYDLRMDAWRDYYADMDESMAEGFEKGKVEGEIAGFEKGKKEEKVMIAKNLKNMGMAIADIAAATGLTAEEVESL